MNRIILKSLFAAGLLIGLGSCTNYHKKQGDQYYEHIAYSDAINHYEKVYRKNNDTEVELKLADAYFRTGKLDSSETIYKRAIERGSRAPKLYFNYGKVLMANGKHKEAADYFKRYLQVHNNDLVAKMLLTSCNSVIERYRDTTLFELKPIMEDQFTSAFSIVEYQNGAIFVADKEVFRGRKQAAWTGNSYLDLYTMRKDVEGNWMAPELLQGDVNGQFHEGPACFTKDGNTVYFTRSNYYKRKMVINQEEENNLKIFKATLMDGKWKNLEDFPYNSDDYSVGHPTLSEDGKTMYFVSDMPGGTGGTDIYKTILENGKWSKPVNLGNEINTAGNEMFPYVHTDGTLYFSSDAHNSMGGLDVFITYFNGTRWATPENLNYPLNSVKDDFGFSINKDQHTGFVSSSRTKTDKMYAFEKNPPTFTLYGIAHEKGNTTPISGVIVEVTNAATKEVVSMVSDAKGNFKMKLAPETEYLLYCTKFGCFSRTDNISTKGLKYSEDFFADFEVEPIVIDKPIVLENIYYDFDKWNIRPDAALELNKLVRILKDNPTIDIEMGSHTDSRGSDRYNLVLSDKRAHAAVDYLISQGIEPKRLTYRGYGETVHVNNCKNDVPCSEEEHQKNRRTEFKVKKVHDK
jgi:outer membrane protein OmpA-like peptidoglycan-associated protein